MNNWQHKNDGEDLVLREFVFNSETYAAKYDEIQTTIHELSGIDELLAGRSYTHNKYVYVQPSCMSRHRVCMYNITA